MVKRKVYSTIFAIVFLFLVVVPVYAESNHPFEPYMPTPKYKSNVPASAVFINYYDYATGTYYCRYMYSTILNNNLVYIDTTSPSILKFETGYYFGFTFSDSVWSYSGYYGSNSSVFSNVTMDWILENGDIYCNVDIVDVDGNVLFKRNSQIIDGVLIPNDYNGENEVPEDPEPDPEDPEPDYDKWYERVFGSITEWFGGVLEVLATPFIAIADGLSGLWKEVKNLVNNIKEALKSLFIPSVNIVPLIMGKFDEKFPIISQVGDLFSNLYNPGTQEPVFTITYNGMTLKIIDFSMFSENLTMIRNFTGVFLLLSFLTKETKRLPRLLRGRD